MVSGGRGLNIRVELGGGWRDLERRWGGYQVQDLIDHHTDWLVERISAILKTAMLREYDRENTPYTGTMRKSIGLRRRGRTIRVGLFPEGGETTSTQDPAVYFRSMLYGWTPKSDMSLRVIANRIYPWVRRKLGISDVRHARAVALKIAENWAAEGFQPRRNFLDRVIKVAQQERGQGGRGPKGFMSAIRAPYNAEVARVVKDARQRLLRTLQYQGRQGNLPLRVRTR